MLSTGLQKSIEEKAVRNKIESPNYQDIDGISRNVEKKNNPIIVQQKIEMAKDSKELDALRDKELKEAEGELKVQKAGTNAVLGQPSSFTQKAERPGLSRFVPKPFAMSPVANQNILNHAFIGSTVAGSDTGLGFGSTSDNSYHYDTEPPALGVGSIAPKANVGYGPSSLIRVAPSMKDVSGPSMSITADGNPVPITAPFREDAFDHYGHVHFASQGSTRFSGSGSRTAPSISSTSTLNTVDVDRTGSALGIETSPAHHSVVTHESTADNHATTLSQLAARFSETANSLNVRSEDHNSEIATARPQFSNPSLPMSSSGGGVKHESRVMLNMNAMNNLNQGQDTSSKSNLDALKAAADREVEHLMEVKREQDREEQQIRDKMYIQKSKFNPKSHTMTQTENKLDHKSKGHITPSSASVLTKSEPSGLTATSSMTVTPSSHVIKTVTSSGVVQTQTQNQDLATEPVSVLSKLDAIETKSNVDVNVSSSEKKIKNDSTSSSGSREIHKTQSDSSIHDVAKSAIPDSGSKSIKLYPDTISDSKKSDVNRNDLLVSSQQQNSKIAKQQEQLDTIQSQLTQLALNANTASATSNLNTISNNNNPILSSCRSSVSIPVCKKE